MFKVRISGLAFIFGSWILVPLGMPAEIYAVPCTVVVLIMCITGNVAWV